MIKVLTITKAREELPNLVKAASTKLDEYIITVNGIHRAVIMSAVEYESWKETNEILADKGLMRAIKQGEKELDGGKGIPWEKVKKDLGINV